MLFSLYHWTSLYLLNFDKLQFRHVGIYCIDSWSTFQQSAASAALNSLRNTGAYVHLMHNNCKMKNILPALFYLECFTNLIMHYNTLVIFQTNSLFAQFPYSLLSVVAERTLLTAQISNSKFIFCLWQPIFVLNYTGRDIYPHPSPATGYIQ